MSVRRKGRELALQVLYQLDMSGETSEQGLHAFADSFDVSPKAREFAWDLVRSDKPVIVLTGHLGNWEAMGLALGAKGADAAVVARRLDELHPRPAHGIAINEGP
jgi:hypothetical protein